MKQRGQRRLSESVHRMRWIIVAGIWVVVIGYQVLKELVLDLGSAERTMYGIILYAFVGSMVTWFALTWVGSRIAEGERAKRKIREDEAYIASVVSASADAILSLDPQGIITSWNNGAGLIYGYREEEVLGKHYAMLLPEHLLASGEVERLAAESQEKGHVRNLETQRRKKDGRVIDVEVTHTALRGSKGDVKGYSAVVRDITEKKEARKRQREAYERMVEAEREVRQLNLELEDRIAQRTESLRQTYEELERSMSELERYNEELKIANDKLQELDRMKSEFVSMVSHSLRAPVTNISVAIELLVGSEVSGEDEQRKEMLEIIQGESARLTRLVQGVLIASRLEGGRLELKREPTDMRALSEKAIQSMEAGAQGYSLSLVCSDDLPKVCADADSVEEVLINLISNAIQYSPDSGKIQVQLVRQGDSVITSVIDEGIGIPQEELERVFERFYRVDGSDSGLTGGYGLGLYICKRLIEAQGGTIQARSTEGVGSIISFSLPISGRIRSAKEDEDRGKGKSARNRR